MPNWNDPESIKKWLKEQEKDTVSVTRRREQKAGDKPTVHLADLVPAPASGQRAEPDRRTWRPPATNDGPRPESTYRAPERGLSDKAGDYWAFASVEVPRELTPYSDYQAPPERNSTYDLWHGMRDTVVNPSFGEPAYTNYQALPEFVTSQRRNPAGGYAGIMEGQSVPNLPRYGTLPRPLIGDLYLFGQSEDFYNAPDKGGSVPFNIGQDMAVETMPPLEDAPWSDIPNTIRRRYANPEWNKTGDLWRRIMQADIVPKGQVVYLGDTMHPSRGPEPVSYYFTGNADVPLEYFMNEYNTYR